MSGCNNSKNTSDNKSSANDTGDFKYDYGVFLSYEGDLSKLSDYKAIVIDAQYYDKDEIADFKSKGHFVYSYINVGSLEDFRTYYDDYKDLSLGNYEHWDEEIWINVYDDRWQDFILNNLAVELEEKDIDGFFVDNCDVYYYHPSNEIYEGLSTIMKGLVASGKYVIINGGDAFLNEYCNNNANPHDVVSAINQESVFSCINWDSASFGTSDEESKKYFTEYIEKYSEQGIDIYLLEYTNDDQLIEEIKKYSNEKGFHYYISDSLELDY